MEEKIFNHIGISINDLSEVENFYVNILKMEIKKKFTLNKSISEKVFNILQEIEVTVVKKGDLIIELFNHNNILNDFSHVCMLVDDRYELIHMAQKYNYPCKIIKRESFDMVFIRDKSNNLFEIKLKD